MILCYDIPNSTDSFYFNTNKIAAVLCQPNLLNIRIQFEGLNEYETLIFTSEDEYDIFKDMLTKNWRS